MGDVSPTLLLMKRPTNTRLERTLAIYGCLQVFLTTGVPNTAASRLGFLEPRRLMALSDGGDGYLPQ